MNADLAHKILGTNSSSEKDDIRDAFLNKWFAIKKEILMQITFLPSFLKGKVRLVNQLAEAEAFLLSENLSNIELGYSLVISDKSKTILDFFLNYERQITEVKLQLSNSNTRKDIVNSISELNAIQKGYILYLFNYGKNTNFIDSEEIPLKNQIDSGLIIKEIKEAKESNLLLKELLRVRRLSELLKKVEFT